MVWLIIAVCVLMVIGYLLFAPFFVEIDSTKGIYGIRFHRLVVARLVFKENSVFIGLSIAGWKKQIDLAAPKTITKEPAKRKKDKERKKIPFQKLLAVIRSFRVRKFFLSLDTGDMQLNGILYPLSFYAGRRSGKNIRVNFWDENKLILQVHNTLGRMLWAYARG